MTDIKPAAAVLVLPQEGDLAQHVDAVRTTLATGADFLVVGLTVGRGRPVGWSTRPSPGRFLDRKLRLDTALAAGLTADERDRTHVVAIPRPEAAWEWVASAFPGPRTWVASPNARTDGDRHPQLFVAAGERLLRLVVTPAVDPGSILEQLRVASLTPPTPMFTSQDDTPRRWTPGTEPEEPGVDVVS